MQTKKVSIVKSAEPAYKEKGLLDTLRAQNQHKQLNGPYTLYNTDFIVKTIRLKR